MSLNNHSTKRISAWLDAIERAGNRLPDPVTLFIYGTLIIAVLSALVSLLGWQVTKTVNSASGQDVTTQIVHANNLLSSDGIAWLLSNLVNNFITFPPLGIVLVGMLGIGVAEKSGLLGVTIKMIMSRTPASLLTPVTVLVGIMSSMTLDAGYVVLPPLVMAIYAAIGRPPLAGLAAVFAGVSAGFSANLFITGLDPLLAGFTQAGAQLIDPAYQVAVTGNWWFMIASTILLTLVGWAVTAKFVEPRLASQDTAISSEKTDEQEGRISAQEWLGLKHAGVVLAVFFTLVLMMIFIPDAPLHGQGKRFDRWVEAIIPLLFLFFLLPGLAYGITVGTIRNDKDFAKMMAETLSSLGPYIVMAFFAAQFIAAFKYTGLGEMLALSGGAWLAETGFSMLTLLVTFIIVVMMGNLLIGSASAKYAFFAPVFVPMLMQVGVSPELTQAAYRIGDSVSNIITPLNPYMVIILVYMRQYVPQSGFGTLVAVMLPYTLFFLVAWVLLLALWLGLGWELGPGSSLHYP